MRFSPLFVLYKSLWGPTCVVHLEHVLIQVHIVTCGQWLLHRHSHSRFSQLSTPSWKLHWAPHRRVWSPVGQHLCIASRIQQRWVGWIHIGLHSPPQKAGAERLTPVLLRCSCTWGSIGVLAALEAEMKLAVIFAGQQGRSWFSVAILVKVTLPGTGSLGSQVGCCLSCECRQWYAQCVRELAAFVEASRWGSILWLLLSRGHQLPCQARLGSMLLDAIPPTLSYIHVNLRWFETILQCR